MMHKFFHKDSESGRSLIELIAVLVIMALLLIASLIGFKALLDYLNKKETVEQIGVIGMRYKVDRLNKKCRSAGGCKVSASQFYPEGIHCDGDKSCVKTRDGGEIRVFSTEDTDTFVVIATQISPLSCAEAVLQGGYTRVKKMNDFNTNKPEVFLTGELNASNNQKVFDEKDYLSLQDFRDHPDKVMDYCCYDKGSKETYKHCSFGFVYTSGAANKYMCNGKWSSCACDQVQDSEGNCCESGKLHCGVCGGCPGGTTCNAGRCVECTSDDDCAKYCKEGKKELCKTGDKQYCDKTRGICKPCQTINQVCGTDAGSGNTLYCDANLDCPDPDSKECEVDDPHICCECRKFDLDKNQCVDAFKKDLSVGERCKKTRNIAEKNCPDKCYGKNVECAGGICKCVSSCPNPRLAEGSECVKECGNNGCCDTTKGLDCINGTCQKPGACDDVPASALRLFNRGCKPDICPCANDHLYCNNDSKTCKCATLPTKIGDECWGECGCGAGLECQDASKKDLGTLAAPDANNTNRPNKAQKGTCQCHRGTKMNDVCTKDCTCNSTTVSDTDKRPLLVCYTNETSNGDRAKILFFNKDAKEFSCQCNPAVEQYSLPAGSRCIVGCNQCGPDKDHALPCINGKCGCTTPADCKDDCDGKTQCDSASHVCVCDAGRGLIPGNDGKCYCKTNNVADKSKTFWRIPNNLNQDVSKYLCCPKGQVPYPFGNKYVCRRKCTNINEKPLENLALLVDYSNSTLLNGYRSKIDNAAKVITEKARSLGMKVGVFREDNSTIAGVTCTPSGSCNGNKTQIKIQGFSTGNPDLNQSTCACNCQSGGITCFNKATGLVSGTCRGNDTLAILISDGVIPTATAMNMGCPEDRTYVIADPKTKSLDMPLGHQLPYASLTAKGIDGWLEQIIENATCVPEADAIRIESNWVCSAAN